MASVYDVQRDSWFWRVFSCNVFLSRGNAPVLTTPSKKGPPLPCFLGNGPLSACRDAGSGLGPARAGRLGFDGPTDEGYADREECWEGLEEAGRKGGQPLPTFSRRFFHDIWAVERRGPVISQPVTSRHKSVTTNFVENRTPFIVESHRDPSLSI